jgi:hypothetical protein
MNPSRQVTRRTIFARVLERMPKIETWETEDYDVAPKVVATSMYQAGIEAVTKKVEVEPPKIRHHFRFIPRWVRRSMARDLMKREFRAVRGL